MKAQAAILDESGADIMNLPATEPGNLRERNVPTKFLYQSGSRPLDGYTIKRGIGRGGFGEVYYATSDGGKEVAIKLIRRNLDVELRGVAHCINLKHPNLLALYDIRRDADDDTWVVMEFVGGDTLDNVIARHPNGLPTDEVLTWIHGIGAGVAYLHDHGIVHRDLKPGNIFCDEGIIKLGDYGLSKFISASRRSGQTESVGTVHYMAPEVANGRYGKEIDIYALGVILYEMLTGHVPFEGESVGEVLMKHLTARPDLSGVSEPYRALLDRILDKDPARRPQSVGEVLAALPKPGTQGFYGVAPQSSRATPPPLPLLNAAAGPSIAAATVTKAWPEEPIWKAVKQYGRDLKTAWDRAELNTPLKVIIVSLIVLLLLAWSGLLIAAVVLYGIYYGVRATILAIKGPDYWVFNKLPPPALAVPAAPIAAVAARPIEPLSAVAATAPRVDQFWPSSNERPSVVLPLASARDNVAEVIGAMLLSALVTVCACFLVHTAFIHLEPNQFVWLALVGTAGAWAVIVPAKFWQGHVGDEMSRRSVLLVAGLALGLYAWGLDRVMLVSLPYSTNPHLRSHAVRLHLPSPVNEGLANGDGSPRLTGFLAYFGFLYLVPRWWSLNDPLRRRRFSLWKTGMYGLWAWVLTWFWPFPDQFAITAATTIAAAVQLSSPWLKSRFDSSAPQPASAAA